MFRIIKLSGAVNIYGYEEMICKAVHQKKKNGDGSQDELIKKHQTNSFQQVTKQFNWKCSFM